MPVRPNVVFTAFRSATDPRREGWALLRSQLADGARRVGAAIVVTETDAKLPDRRAGAKIAQAGVWRLLASNNRELGRSALTYSSFDAARAHVLQLQEQADDLVVTAVPGTSAGTHGWLAAIDEAAVMTAGRWYGATSSSLEAAAGTIAALRSALVMSSPRSTGAVARRLKHAVTTPESTKSW